MHLNEWAAYRERHLPTVAHYEVVTNPFPAARGTDGDEGGADRDEPQTHEPKVPRMGQPAFHQPPVVSRSDSKATYGGADFTRLGLEVSPTT